MPLHPVCPVSELRPGERKLVTIGRVEIGVFNVDGTFHAYRNVCPHAGAPVCVGRIGGTTLPSPVYEYNYGREGRVIRCPWHGWEFDLETGEHLVDPATRLKKIPVEVAPDGASPGCGHASENLDKFPVEIQEGVLHVRLPG
jgi:Ferredoxin subunits of nitrite reductase and ring-hydroxylating dioxygenases